MRVINYWILWITDAYTYIYAGGEGGGTMTLEGRKDEKGRLSDSKAAIARLDSLNLLLSISSLHIYNVPTYTMSLRLPAKTEMQTGVCARVLARERASEQIRWAERNVEHSTRIVSQTEGAQRALFRRVRESRLTSPTTFPLHFKHPFSVPYLGILLFISYIYVYNVPFHSSSFFLSFQFFSSKIFEHAIKVSIIN